MIEGVIKNNIMEIIGKYPIKKVVFFSNNLLHNEVNIYVQACCNRK